MLSRLPVMQPIGPQPEVTPTTGCDATEPEAKRTKRSEEHNPFAVFQEVRSRTTRRAAGLSAVAHAVGVAVGGQHELALVGEAPAGREGEKALVGTA